MTTLSKARDLLAEFDRQIAEAERSLKSLKAERTEISQIVQRLSRGAAGRGRRGRPPKAIAKKRGRPKLRKATRAARTNWTQVISGFKGPFTLDDLVRASERQKGTVNQAVQNLKKAKKIVSTGKRGEYRRTSPGGIAEPKAARKKVVKSDVDKQRTMAQKAEAVSASGVSQS